MVASVIYLLVMLIWLRVAKSHAMSKRTSSSSFHRKRSQFSDDSTIQRLPCCLAWWHSHKNSLIRSYRLCARRTQKLPSLWVNYFLVINESVFAVFYLYPSRISSRFEVWRPGATTSPNSFGMAYTNCRQAYKHLSKWPVFLFPWAPLFSFESVSMRSSLFNTLLLFEWIIDKFADLIAVCELPSYDLKKSLWKFILVWGKSSQLR